MKTWLSDSGRLRWPVVAVVLATHVLVILTLIVSAAGPLYEGVRDAAGGATRGAVASTAVFIVVTLLLSWLFSASCDRMLRFLELRALRQETGNGDA